MSLKTPKRSPLTRREALGLLGGAAAGILLPACGGGYNAPYTGGNGSCTRVAEETTGPFPADGSNTDGGTVRNVLTDARAMRTNIVADFDGTSVQPGTPLTLTLTLLNLNNNCARLAGYYVYVWHANASALYSQYGTASQSSDESAHSYLRGIAVTDAYGQVSFTTIFPGREAGRATHIHFEVYPDATPQVSEKIATSQLAFPASVTEGASSPYANATLYPGSASNNTQNANDPVFSDGTGTEMLSVTGNTTSGYMATLTIAVAA